jgi:hypothetical protein
MSVDGHDWRAWEANPGQADRATNQSGTYFIFLACLPRATIVASMPTLEHNGFVDMFRENPSLAPRFVATLLGADPTLLPSSA